MATVFQRVEKFRQANNKPPLSKDQLSALGRQVIEAYYPTKLPETVINRIPQSEGLDIIRVIDYPRKFSQQIDKMVSAYYSTIEPKKRKRIPYKTPLNH